MSDRKGKLTISRVRSNRGEGHVTIRIEDDTSGCIACEVKVSVVEFAEALMGHGYRECQFSLNESGVIGKKRELREIVIPRPPSEGRRREEDAVAGLAWIQKKAAKELVDGWMPNHPSDVFNSHQWTGDKQVRVSLIRFV